MAKKRIALKFLLFNTKQIKIKSVMSNSNKKCILLNINNNITKTK